MTTDFSTTCRTWPSAPVAGRACRRPELTISSFTLAQRIGNDGQLVYSLLTAALCASRIGDGGTFSTAPWGRRCAPREAGRDVRAARSPPSGEGHVQVRNELATRHSKPHMRPAAVSKSAMPSPLPLGLTIPAGGDERRKERLHRRQNPPRAPFRPAPGPSVRTALAPAGRCPCPSSGRSGFRGDRASPPLRPSLDRTRRQCHLDHATADAVAQDDAGEAGAAFIEDADDFPSRIPRSAASVVHGEGFAARESSRPGCARHCRTGCAGASAADWRSGEAETVQPVAPRSHSAGSSQAGCPGSPRIRRRQSSGRRARCDPSAWKSGWKSGRA